LRVGGRLADAPTSSMWEESLARAWAVALFCNSCNISVLMSLEIDFWMWREPPDGRSHWRDD
jgi:hypothetical protein